MGRQSLMAELNQRGDLFMPDTDASKNCHMLITQWQTVHAHIQVSFVFLFFCDIFNMHAFVVAEQSVFTGVMLL